MLLCPAAAATGNPGAGASGKTAKTSIHFFVNTRAQVKIRLDFI
jgi:hypothetical protein